MEQTSFPRGTENTKKRSLPSKIDSTSASIVKKIKKDENLFGNDVTKKRRSTRLVSSKNTTAVTTLPQGIQPGGGSVLPASLRPKRDALIENISFAKIDKGTKLLGVIRGDGLTEEFCIVSLPNMLTGFIRRGIGGGDSITPLTQVLSPNQMLSVIVISKSVDSQSKRKIELSMLPQDINSGILPAQLYLPGLLLRGQIQSIEDHGCIVHVGLGNSITAFLKFENAKDYNISSSELCIGRCYDFYVEKPKVSNLSSSSSNKVKKRRREIEIENASHILIQLVLPRKKDREQSAMTQLTQASGPSAVIGGGISSGTTQTMSSYTVKSLIPGMLVECYVEEYARNGLLVTFLNNVFRGAIDENHLGFLYAEDQSKKNGDDIIRWKDIWKEEAYVTEVTARIIAVDPITKLLRLSILPHIMRMSVPLHPKIHVGDVLQNTVVVRVDGSIGALLAIDNEATEENKESEDNTTLLSHPLARFGSKYKAEISRIGLYVKASKAFDKENVSENDLHKLFKKHHSAQTSVRVLTCSHCLIENFCTASTAPSILSAHVLSYSDLKPGQVYRKAKILSYHDYGIIVSLGQNIRALCQTIHLSDTATTNGASSDFQKKAHRIKFAQGKHIDVKCLSVDLAKKQAYVTHKKSMLSDKLEPLVSHTQIAKNQIYVGHITKIDPTRGIVVAFYNNIYGYCTAKRLAKEIGIEDVSQSYRVGNVVKCRVVQLSRNNHKLELSLDTTSDAIERDKKELEENNSQDVLTVGMKVPSISVKIIQMTNSSKDELKNKVLHGFALAVVKLKHLNTGDKKMKGEIECRIPYDQLEDFYPHKTTDNMPMTLDDVASRTLKVGKRIEKDAIVLLTSESTADSMPILSLRPSFITAYDQYKDNKKKSNFVPSNADELYIGAKVIGYVAHLDQRYGCFVRFANNLTGLIPKLKKGLDEKIFNTVKCRITSLDCSTSPPRIILRKSKKIEKETESGITEIKEGCAIGDVLVEDINFYRATVSLLDKKYSKGRRLKARIHVTMCEENNIASDECDQDNENKEKKEKRITKYHPFFKWKEGLVIQNTTCVTSIEKNGVTHLELTNRSSLPKKPVVAKIEDYTLGDKIVCMVTEILKNNYGIKVQVCPGVSNNISGLELSDNVDVLNNLESHYHVGQRIGCKVIQKIQPAYRIRNKKKQKNCYQLSTLPDEKLERTKPKANDIIVARINRGIPQSNAPALMMDYRNGMVARCCITELSDRGDWTNMPLGKVVGSLSKSNIGAVVTDDEHDNDKDYQEDIKEARREKTSSHSTFPTGKYVQCKVLASKSSVIEVSLQKRRIKGDIDNDKIPKIKDIVQAYVVSTNKKGCYVRLSRNITGRIILKELSDSFIPDPIATFPQGRLVQCKVKILRSKENDTIIDLDMRESSILESEDKLTFDEVEEGAKYKGVITRIERYGVFVRLDNSRVSGLAHITECSDEFIAGGLDKYYDPGDLVKVYVLNLDKDAKQVNFSLKASYFEGDIDSDDESSSESDCEDERSTSNDEVLSDAYDSEIDNKSIDSNDENFASKLAKKMSSPNESSDDESSSESESGFDEESSSDEESVPENKNGMDTNVGFDWGENNDQSMRIDDDSSSESDASSEDDELSLGKKSKLRKKSSLKRQEEKKIALREIALADGTLDVNPETRADFERLIASNPNFSEHWIKYMAYYLSLADIDSARNVAKRAFDRIEFRQEGEKLNVWTALLTLELKYGTQTELQRTIERACQHNNPKQVYLRVCEMLERHALVSISESKSSSSQAKLENGPLKHADAMFAKMCKKFKGKKTVWIAHLKYLLKTTRHQEAHELLKRSLKSLPTYKHVETVTKFAQLEFEYGNVERARTIFDGVLLKYPKRLDLVFVYVDKEIKTGDIDAARSIFKRVVDPHSKIKFKFSDKQMKSLFKKWYSIEDTHGNEESKEEVKISAKAYVDRTSLGSS